MRLPSAMPARVATVVMRAPKPSTAMALDDADALERGHAVTLSQPRDSHRLVLEPHDPGAQPPVLERRQQAGAASLALGARRGRR